MYRFHTAAPALTGSLKLIAIFGGVGLTASLLLAGYGLDYGIF